MNVLFINPPLYTFYNFHNTHQYAMYMYNLATKYKMAGNKVKIIDMERGYSMGDRAVSLTPVGQKKVDAMTLKKPFFDVMNTIQDAGGTATIREIVKETKLPYTQVNNAITSLTSSGYIKVTKIT